jgi:hypothetical protein
MAAPPPWPMMQAQLFEVLRYSAALRVDCVKGISPVA